MQFFMFGVVSRLTAITHKLLTILPCATVKTYVVPTVKH